MVQQTVTLRDLLMEKAMAPISTMVLTMACLIA